MFTRPKPGDDEDDILRQQEEFLRKKDQSSASVVNKRKAENEKSSSIFAKSRDSKKGKRTSETVDRAVLGDIKEKIIDGSENWSFKPPSTTEGFPTPFRGRLKFQGPEGSGSIFSQSLEKQDGLSVKHKTDSESTVYNTRHIIGDRSFILSGPDALAIHSDNLEKLSKLSSEEILAEQEKLKAELDPKLLEFIKSRRKKREVAGNSASSLKMDCDTPSTSVIPDGNSVKEVTEKEATVKELLKTSGVLKDEANRWLHMDIVEEEKISWIGDIPPAKPVAPDSPYSARFNFEGLLMPFSAESVDVREGLYNHGEEPERPGYTVEELYQLCRSSVLQQRVIALNVIGNILEKAKMGYYDECLSDGLLERLLDHEVFLLLRFALDDNSEAQVAAALKAIRNLLCSQIDEVCLDRILGCKGGTHQPSLSVVHKDINPKEEQELKDSEEELKDYQMLKLDIVKGALRTDLVSRIRYILEILRPGPKAVISALEILTRLVRHSSDTALAVKCCPRLLQIIIKEFVPQDWRSMTSGTKPSEMQSVYGVPLVEALKLLRVLACRSRTFASDFIHKHSIMKSIMNYVSVDPREVSLPLQEVLRLSLESLYIWQTMLKYNLGAQQFVEAFPVFMRLLQFHYMATSIDDMGSSFAHEHGTALISLIQQALSTSCYQSTLAHTFPRTLEYFHLKDFVTLVEMCLNKWLTQMSKVQDMTFSSAKLLGATLRCMAYFYSCQIAQTDTNIVESLENVEKIMKTGILPFLHSQGFKNATAQLRASSCLLFDGEIGTKRDPAPVPSLGSMMWQGQSVTPVLQPKSPVPLLQGLSYFIWKVSGIHKGLSSQYVETFFSDPLLIQYIKQVADGASAVLGTHWFTRLEVLMLFSMLKLAKDKEFELPSGLLHNLAFRLATLIQKDEKLLLKDLMSQVIFNIDFLKQTSVLAQSMAQLHLKEYPLFPGSSSKLKLIVEAVDEMPALWGTYEKILGLRNCGPQKGTDVTSCTATEKGTELILPIDWTYLPIIHLHSQEKSAQVSSDESISMVVRALKWTLLVEWLRPSVTDSVSVTDRFCRLATVFLSGSDMFLHSQVHTLLAAGLATLMDSYPKIVFPPSFYDLYTQLLEQFQGVSYGDPLFGHFLLVPLQQRHSANLRKQVWSEHAAVIRILSTPLDHLMFPLPEMLEPCETESSLLWTYLRCLATGTVRETWSPVLYWVAVHHVATFIQVHQDTGLAQQIRENILKLGKQELQTLLLDYKGPPTVT